MLLPDGRSTLDPNLDHPGCTYPRKSSRLYATKDGEDLVYKTGQFTFLGFKYGSGLAAAEMILNSNPATLSQIGFRYLQISVPVTLMAASFSAGVAVSSAVTKRDDYVNHFVGGLTSGAVLSACTGSARYGAMAGILAGTVGGLVKMSYKEGVNVFGWQEEPRYRMMTIHHNSTWDPWRKPVDVEDAYRS